MDDDPVVKGVSQLPPPSSTLAMHALRLRFKEPNDETLYLRHSMGLPGPGALSGVLVTHVLFLFATGDDSFGATPSAVLFCIGRLLPALLLLLYAHCFLDSHVHWWSTLASGALFLSTVSVSATGYWCHVGVAAEVDDLWSCDAVLTHGLPWRAVAVLMVLPPLAAVMHCNWLSTSVAAVAAYIAYLGLVVAELDRPGIGSAAAAPLLSLVLLCYGIYVVERNARESWRVTVSSNRKTVALLHNSLNTAVVQEQGARLARLVKRSSFLVYELDAKLVIQFMSATSNTLIGTQADTL
jgi:hypothetical protein